ncbi:MAG: glycosyltransferase family 39 protein [Anaerolineae bacterium]|nr:glycosyltransferase family 39 protein [Anaerolineae bacterium]
MQPPLTDRRLVAALLITVAAIWAILVAVTPYNLHAPGTAMLFPLDPPPLSFLSPVYAQLRSITPALPGAALLLTAALGGAASVWLYRKEGRRAAGKVAPLFALGMAASGQAFAINAQYTPAVIFYLLAAATFGAWAWGRRAQLAGRIAPVAVARRWETAALVGLFLATVLARFYELQRIPYGVEGDEAKWTVEVAGVMVDQMQVLSSDWHFGGVPGSFYMQAPFHRLLGPSLLSARIAVAVYSVIATFVFYGFVRAFYNIPIALLATGFVSVSMLDLSASRSALVEGHNKLWVVTAPALLMLALKYRRWQLFALAGGAFGFGILTYDTYLPMLGVGGALLLIDTALDLWQTRDPRDVPDWAARWAAFGLALFVFFGRAYYYIGGRGGDYKLEDVGWTGAPVETLLRGVGRILRVFAEQVDADFLHTRQGPLINGALIPFVALGAVGCLLLWQRREARLPLIWAGLVIFPVPVVLHIAYPRVLYPSLPALYLLAAIGLYWALRALWEWSNRLGRRALLAALLAGLVVYPAYNLYIYFNQLRHDDATRVTTREMSDFLLHYAREGRLILVPYLPLSSDLVEGSKPWYNFYLRQHYANGTQERYYRLVAYADLLPVMTRLFGDSEYDSIGVLVDSNVLDMAPREHILGTVRRCYRADVTWGRKYSRLMLFDAAAQAQAPCYGARATLTLTPSQDVYDPGAPPYFRWSVSAGAPLQAALQCQRQSDAIQFVEAEDFTDLQYYTFRADAVAGASGRGVISDEPGAEFPLASTMFEIDEPGRYQVWARTYRLRADDYPLYLLVGDHAEALGFSVDPPLNTWHWELVGTFDRPAGATYLAVTRPYEGEKPWAIYFDALAFSRDTGYTPDRVDGRWDNYLPGARSDLPLPGMQQGVFPAPVWEPGFYRCRAGVWDGERLVDNDGAPGIWSEWIELAFVEPVEP